ncbi:MAG: hypothetical protein NT163_03175 [Chlorobiales bacterium]|nr:hypothetical protein [Chlorobiales bacterium]
MRMMVWERAKGEMGAVLQTFWTEEFDEDFFDGARVIVERFINEFEDSISLA